ncbi:MAG: flagellar hook-basal body complex protein FliE [Gammaproteobacteria bacterium]|jgi:flagellar hook-basal body complex protein FliE
MTVSSVAMQQALEQLRAMREAVRPVDAGAAAPGGPAATTAVPTGGAPSFFDTMRAAVDSVNEQQSLSRQLQSSYVRGEDVSLTDVAIAMQRSSVAFEATVQVRNKVLESYKEIMSMTV